MRIAVTSDLHFHLPWYGTLKQFAERLRKAEPDVLIIAGDLGEPIDMFELCLRTFQQVAETRAALAGNHDVWHRTLRLNSEQLWLERLPEMAKRYNYHWLDHQPLVLDALAVVGGIAWYDYSGKHPTVGLSDDEYEAVKAMISNDGNYIDWEWSDRDFAAMVGDALMERLKKTHDNPHVEDILIATHVPLFNGTQRYQDDGSNRVIANAYYANLTLGERILPYDKVRMAVSGHVHVNRKLLVERDGQPSLPVFTNPSDYGRPAALIIDTETWKVEHLLTEGTTELK